MRRDGRPKGGKKDIIASKTYRCAKPWAWHHAIALTICGAHHLRSASETHPSSGLDSRRSCSEPPGAKSITMLRCDAPWKAQNRCGHHCVRDCSARRRMVRSRTGEHCCGGLVSWNGEEEGRDVRHECGEQTFFRWICGHKPCHRVCMLRGGSGAMLKAGMATVTYTCAPCRIDHAQVCP